METVEVKYLAPKELWEVGIAVEALVAGIKAKKSLLELSGDLLPKFYAAVEGVDKLDDDAKSNLKASLEAGGHIGGKLVAAVLA